jgi:hypothetical protein
MENFKINIYIAREVEGRGKGLREWGRNDPNNIYTNE